MDNTVNDDAHGPEDVGARLIRRGLRGRRGGLKDMPHMPLDILVEIFSFMHPRDLLNLARTTKLFRAFLMRPSSAPFWRSARRNVEGLPDCPPYLSEPEYANLMFFPYCHGCLTSNIHNIIFEFSARYCNQCKRRWLERIDGHESFVNEVREVTGRDEAFLNTLYVVRGDNEYVYLHIPVLSSLKEAWRNLRDDHEARIQLIQEHINAVRLVEESCDALYAWVNAQANNRAEELYDLRTERFNSVIARLRGEGWGAELDVMSEDNYAALASQPYVRRPAGLTARAWANIRENAHAFMQEVEADRLRNERRAVLYNRLEVFVHILNTFRGPNGLRTAELDMEPMLIDYALSPQMMPVLNDPGPGGMVFPSGAEALSMRATLAGFVDWWKASCKTELEGKVVEAIPELAGVDDPLSLAIVKFTCTGRCTVWQDGRAPLRFPEVLAHACTRGPPPLLFTEDLYTATVAECCGSLGLISFDCLTVNPETVQHLRDITEVFGLDALKAKHEDLDNCDKRLTCARCIYTPAGHTAIRAQLEAFDWRRALQHYKSSKHANRTGAGHSCSWHPIEEAVSREVRRRERCVLERLEREMRCGSRMGCGYCVYNCPGGMAMCFHLQDRHGIYGLTEADIGQHAYVHYDSETVIPPVRVVYHHNGGFHVE